MTNLISGKEALIALVNGEEVEFKCGGMSWTYLDAKQQPIQPPSLEERLLIAEETINVILGL